jgi:hypothetical protein
MNMLWFLLSSTCVFFDVLLVARIFANCVERWGNTTHMTEYQPEEKRKDPSIYSSLFTKEATTTMLVFRNLHGVMTR